MREPITKLAIVPLHAVDRTIIDCLAPTIKQLSLAASGNEAPVIFFIARAVKKSHHHFDVKRVVLVTLGYLLLYDEKGTQTRAILVSDIQRVIVCQDSFVVFKIPREHDLVLKLDEPVYLEYFINILIVLKAHHAAKTPASAVAPAVSGKKRRDDIAKGAAGASADDQQLDVQASGSKYEQLPGINKVNLVRNGVVKYAENVPIPMILSVDATRQDFVEAILRLAPPPPLASESGEGGQPHVRSAADLATAREVLRHPLFRPPQRDSPTAASVPVLSAAAPNGVAQPVSSPQAAAPTTLIATLEGEARPAVATTAGEHALASAGGAAGTTPSIALKSASPSEAPETGHRRNTPPPAVKIRAVTPVADGRGGLSSPECDSDEDEHSTLHGGPLGVFARHPVVQSPPPPPPPAPAILSSPAMPSSTPTARHGSSADTAQQFLRSPLFFPPPSTAVTATASTARVQRNSTEQRDQSRNGSGATAGQTFHSRLTAFYEQYDPSRLNTVDELVIEFIGREQQCLDILYRKYGVGPQGPSTAQLTPPPPRPSLGQLRDDGGVLGHQDPHYGVGHAPSYDPSGGSSSNHHISSGGQDAASLAKRIRELEAENRRLSSRAADRTSELTQSHSQSTRPPWHANPGTLDFHQPSTPGAPYRAGAGPPAPSLQAQHGDAMDAFEASIAHHDAQTRIVLRQHRIDSLRIKIHQALGQRTSTNAHASTDARSLIEVGLLQEEILALMSVQQADQDEWDRRRASHVEGSTSEAQSSSSIRTNDASRRGSTVVEPGSTTTAAVSPAADAEYARWYYAEYLPRMMYHHSLSQRQAPPPSPSNGSGASSAKDVSQRNGTDAPAFPVYAGSVYSVPDPRERRQR